MEIATAPGGLPMQIAEIAQVIGAHQHMEHVGPIGHRFQPVELVGRLEGRGDLHEMLGFIDDHRLHVETLQGMFDRLAEV